ncbi:hypothetical protein [Campylobacter sp.]|uniref:hypothetical protein n=1 Tax=Campylobacter sp. TaxID=205 RepID=UPI002AA82C1B|nr:hypothetical protein [Campylobacter sp.]
MTRNSRILWINLEFLEAFCVYRNSRISKACVIPSCVFSFFYRDCPEGPDNDTRFVIPRPVI